MRTPHQTFWLPILRSLVQHGGTATIQELYDDVERVGSLNEYDLSFVVVKGHATNDLHWKNQVRQAASNMRLRGLLVTAKRSIKTNYRRRSKLPCRTSIRISRRKSWIP